MARRKKKTTLLDDFINLAYLISLFLAMQIFFKTGSLMDGVITFFLGAGITFALILAYKYWRRQQFLDAGIDIIDEMDGKVFEQLLGAHFRKQGYKVRLTPPTDDYGADLILDKEGTRLVIQAKRWKQNVGIEAVQQVIGAIKHYNATKGMVVTNSHFTQNAINLAESNGIEMWDRDKLVELLSNSGGRKTALMAQQYGASKTNKSTNDIRCPRCGNKLVLRNGKKGKFLGCDGYPKCWFTQELK